MIDFSNWFQLGSVPANAISGYYDLGLVTLSYVVAVLASYVALNLVGRLRAEKNPRAKIYWLAGGSFTMGAGIWSMHFIGMLAFIMPMPMEYDISWTIASMIVAMLVSAMALYVLQKKNFTVVHLSFAGILIGLGIATMHYMGMAGMHMTIHYWPGLFFVSILVAIFAAEAALWLALQSNQGSNRRQFNLKIISALIMGVAICGMHYTGMAAAVFTSDVPHVMGYESIKPSHLAFFIAGITALIISLALAASSYYKQMVAAVENEKEFLNAMLDNLDDGIIACDAQGNLTVFNQALQKFVSFSKKNKTINDLQDIFSLHTPDNQKVEMNDLPLLKALNGEQIRGLAQSIRFKNNVVRDVIIDGQPIINSMDKKLGAVTVVHDVTELKRTEKLKNEFVSIVSHELRTPLTSIRGSLGLLVSGVMGEFPEKAKKLLEIANNNCERLLLLINDILDIEKIEAGKMDFKIKPVDLTELITEAIDANKMYAEKYGLTIKLHQPEAKITVLVDPDRLMQVLANLISNACKFSPKGTEVELSIKAKKGWVRVSVVDKGPGIPEEFQARIFHKFSQADSSSTRGKGGTGLGLNISKTIIEKFGGQLNFISKENEGTTFFFEIPIHQAESRFITESVSDLHSNSRRLLICEDDEDQSQYLKILLESADYKVDVASTVAEAKRLLAAHDYQALLLDLILPDQDGIAFIRELRASEKTIDLHIIVLSVIAQTGKVLLNGDAFSVVDWLDKPVDFKTLLASIDRIKKETQTIKPHILHIEDNVDTQHVVGTLLENYAKVSKADNLSLAKKMLKEEKFDLVILDLLLPDGNGVDILPLLAKNRLPVLVFSATELNQTYAHYVRDSLIKSNSSNEKLLKTIMGLL